MLARKSVHPGWCAPGTKAIHPGKRRQRASPVSRHLAARFSMGVGRLHSRGHLPFPRARRDLPGDHVIRWSVDFSQKPWGMLEGDVTNRIEEAVNLWVNAFNLSPLLGIALRAEKSAAGVANIRFQWDQLPANVDDNTAAYVPSLWRNRTVHRHDWTDHGDVRHRKVLVCRRASCGVRVADGFAKRGCPRTRPCVRNRSLEDQRFGHAGDLADGRTCARSVRYSRSPRSFQLHEALGALP